MPKEELARSKKDILALKAEVADHDSPEAEIIGSTLDWLLDKSSPSPLELVSEDESEELEDDEDEFGEDEELEEEEIKSK